MRYDLRMMMRGSLFLMLVLGWFLRVEARAEAVRGVSGDFWADMEVGKRDFGEVSVGEIVPYKLNNPGGVVVDRSVDPGRMYVWDSGNNRIVGVDLGQCWQAKVKGEPCRAELVIGQPSDSDWGACNQDASADSWPLRSPAGRDKICSLSEYAITQLEDKTFAGMYVDGEGNLFVPDLLNHRVLKYNSPFTTDNLADEVWGQDNFEDNLCNKGSETASASSFCFLYSGVSFDKGGNMWVADSLNNRVLRFPLINGSIAKASDLVLGQINFVDRGSGAGMDRMNFPTSVSFDSQGRLYVGDVQNKRVLVFEGNLTSGMKANKLVIGDFLYPVGVEGDPWGRGVWVYDYEKAEVGLWRNGGDIFLGSLPKLDGKGGGSIGFDGEKRIYVSAHEYYQDVGVFILKNSGLYVYNERLFFPPGGFNVVNGRRTVNAAWGGIALAGSQLVLAEKRLIFWNNYKDLVLGQPADGYLNAGGFGEIEVDWSFKKYGQLTADKVGHLFVTRFDEIHLFNYPLVSGQKPNIIIGPRIPVLGGGEVVLVDAQGIAVSPGGEYLWVSDVINHRVLKIRDPLTNPMVEVVLGQEKLANNSLSDFSKNLCNMGKVGAANSVVFGVRPGLEMLCYPGALSLDRFGNLFVSDHTIETAGNWRFLMFDKRIGEGVAGKALMAPKASKEFARTDGGLATVGVAEGSHSVFQMAFDSKNRMVVGNNPYFGWRRLQFFVNPLMMNEDDPGDLAFAKYSGWFNDYYGWPVSMVFDDEDNLYVHDANRGRVMVYKTPFSMMGNADRDSDVDFIDLSIWKGEYVGKEGVRSDFNNDGEVDFVDLGIWKNAFVEARS